MDFPDKSVAFVAGFEGFRSRPYRDLIGRWTIGYGSTYLTDGKTPVGPSTPPVTPSTALTLLRTSLMATFKTVESVVKVPLTEDQSAALLSFTYNLGIGNLTRSTLLKKVNLRDFKGAANEFLKWDLAGGKEVDGLERRRVAEKALFETA